MCGSPVPYISRDGKRLVISAGCLNGDPEIKFTNLAGREYWAVNPVSQFNNFSFGLIGSAGQIFLNLTAALKCVFYEINQ